MTAYVIYNQLDVTDLHAAAEHPYMLSDRRQRWGNHKPTFAG
jgi:hypothetical protein